MKKSLYLVLIAGALGLVGCADPTVNIVTQDGKKPKESKEYVPMAAAGVSKDIKKSMADGRYQPYIVATSRFGHRKNPFELNAEERAFDAAQAGERLVIEGGAFGSLWQLPDDKLDQAPPAEQQPYRRLSGILIGDSVLAILEEGGKSTIIRPGMMIPGTDWRVVSIDRDKAILRREGDRLPKEVEVRLEVGFPSGMGGNPNGGPPQGGPPGGFGPGGGRPGAGAGGGAGGA